MVIGGFNADHASIPISGAQQGQQNTPAPPGEAAQDKVWSSAEHGHWHDP
jgi:hypothetical protein